MSILGDRLLAVHGALDEAGFPHAFGGAIALAYCTVEPRGTRDVDVNVFVGQELANAVLDILPEEVTVRPADRETARRDGQVRVRWADTPIDLFFVTHEFHRDVARLIVEVPFEGSRIPILGCEALLVFKAMFGRSRDWADIEEMLAGGVTDGRRAQQDLESLLGKEDPAVVRLAGLLK